jgi:hypothetical protein
MIKRYQNVYMVEIDTINGVVHAVLNDYQLNKLTKELVGSGDDGK